MSAKVYFTDMHCRKKDDNKANKIERLCDAVGLSSIIKKDDLTAIKLHFGEKGNDTYLSPSLVRKVVEIAKNHHAKPFLADTNTLYSGSRQNSVDHIQTAYAHGFAPSVVNAPVIICDGLHGRNEVAIPVKGLKHFTETLIASDIVATDSMIVLSHVKGHQRAGFGGAIKNLAMGCASFWGKRAQHNTKVAVTTKDCIGCGECVQVCPAKALKIVKDGGNKKAVINAEECIGCFECVTVCQEEAIGKDFTTNFMLFVERIAEYACGAVEGKKDRILYINFVMNVTPDCDCVSWSDMPMIADIGILASTDPVAIDKASYDLIKSAKSIIPMENNGVGIDKFAHRWKDTQGLHQIMYAGEIGLGSLEYELIKI